MNKKSLTRSYQLIPFTNIFITNSKNYVDKFGNNPVINAKICCRNIVYNKKNLTKNKWLFNNDDEKIVKQAKKLINSFIRSNVWLIIQEEKPQVIEEHYLLGVGDSVDLIDKRYIRNKYSNIIEDIPEIIKEKYKNNDEVWYYNSLPDIEGDYYCGTEAFILVRNNKVVTSPIINFKIGEQFT